MAGLARTDQAGWGEGFSDLVDKVTTSQDATDEAAAAQTTPAQKSER